MKHISKSGTNFPKSGTSIAMWLFCNIVTKAENMFLKCFQNDFYCYLKHFVNVFCIYLSTMQVGVLLLIPFKRSFFAVLLVI